MASKAICSAMALIPNYTNIENDGLNSKIENDGFNREYHAHSGQYIYCTAAVIIMQSGRYITQRLIILNIYICCYSIIIALQICMIYQVK